MKIIDRPTVRAWAWGGFLKAISISYGGKCPNIWGLARFMGDCQLFGGVNPKYLATAKCSGIFFEISP
jgi:hypothetical protein